MKQYITVEQLKEADDLQLKEICHIFNFQNLQTNMEWIYISQELTIGNMIEILNNKSNGGIKIKQSFDTFAEILDGWQINFMIIKVDNMIEYNSKVRIELVDALWESVKVILK